MADYDELSEYFYDWIQVVENSQVYSSESSIAVSRSDWIKGISLSVLASLIGAASKLAIRKSWLLQRQIEERGDGLLSQSRHESSEDGEQRDRESREPANSTLEAPVPAYHNKGLHIRTPLLDEASSSESSDALDAAAAASAQHDAPTSAARLDEPPLDDRSEIRGDSMWNRFYYSYCCACHTSRKPAEHGGRLGSRHAAIESDGLVRETVPPPRYVAIGLRTAGMVGMTTIHPICSVIAMNYASPSILAPFAGLTLVWVILLSGPLLQEQPTRMQISAVALIISGESLVAVFGDHTNTNQMTPQQVVRTVVRDSMSLDRHHSQLGLGS
jgi:hypothetical protein